MTDEQKFAQIRHAIRDWSATHAISCSMIEELIAEVKAMRPVVVAAEKWRDIPDGVESLRDVDDAYIKATDLSVDNLTAAVDAYRKAKE